jgi:hypothetical protein
LRPQLPRGIATYFGSISTNGTWYAASNVMRRFRIAGHMFTTRTGFVDRAPSTPSMNARARRLSVATTPRVAFRHSSPLRRRRRLTFRSPDLVKIQGLFADTNS